MHVGAESFLRRVATVVTVLCLAIVATTIVAVASPTLRARLGLVPSAPPSYAAGSHIDLPHEMYSLAPVTLFAFVRYDCSGCQATKPILAEIAARLREDSVPTVLVANNLHPEEELRYGTDAGLDRAHVVTMDWAGAGLRLQRVPTFVLVNRTGEVIYASEGVPSESQQKDLLNAATSQLSRQ